MISVMSVCGGKITSTGMCEEGTLTRQLISLDSCKRLSSKITVYFIRFRVSVNELFYQTKTRLQAIKTAIIILRNISQTIFHKSTVELIVSVVTLFPAVFIRQKKKIQLEFIRIS